MIVYFSVVNKHEDKKRNERIKKEVEKIIVNVEEEHEALMILGNFNGHITGLGK